jgi:DNA invertase Pin-like site-specific DNA recombinase
MNSTHTPGTRRAVIYVRISKDRDNETSTETQEDRARAWCAAHGVGVAEVIVERGRSAYKVGRKTRPGMARARTIIDAGLADVFVVWKLDRAGRNTLDLLQWVEWLRGKGADFVSVTEGFDTTSAVGELLMTILAALAKMESATKADRTRDWHAGRVKHHKTPVGPAPLGYLRPEPNKLALDPKTSELARAVLVELVAGGAISAADRQLDAAGVSMSRAALRRWMQCPTIAGLRREPGGRLGAGDWPALIDPADWTRLQERLRRNAEAGGHGNVRRWGLTGIAYCDGCDVPMYVQSSSGRPPRLVCRKCYRTMSYGLIESWVDTELLGALDDNAWDQVRYRGRVVAPDPATTEAELAKLWQMVVSKRLTVEQYDEAALAWEGQAALAEAEPADVPNVESVRAAWPDFTPQERNLIYTAAIRSLRVGVAAGNRDTSRLTMELV